MKTKKLLKSIGEVLEGEGKRRQVERDSLEKLLKRLAEKEAVLAERLGKEGDGGKAAKLKRKIKLLKAQRKKGKQTLSEL